MLPQAYLGAFLKAFLKASPKAFSKHSLSSSHSSFFMVLKIAMRLKFLAPILVLLYSPCMRQRFWWKLNFVSSKALLNIILTYKLGFHPNIMVKLLCYLWQLTSWCIWSATLNFLDSTNRRYYVGNHWTLTQLSFNILLYWQTWRVRN